VSRDPLWNDRSDPDAELKYDLARKRVNGETMSEGFERVAPGVYFNRDKDTRRPTGEAVPQTPDYLFPVPDSERVAISRSELEDLRECREVLGILGINREKRATLRQQGKRESTAFVGAPPLPAAASPVERELELLKRIAGAANTIVAWFHPEDVRSGCVLINVEHYDELNAASDDYCKLLRDKTSPPPPSEKPSLTSVRSTEGDEA
jgi:hypothetical protein